ncbi:MAG TPA: hypothetical protein VD902_04075 [Symbiobacteriaceae bacterium]|nr:hypothetical protein [Symbiobacteriaceae bacterium]
MAKWMASALAAALILVAWAVPGQALSCLHPLDRIGEMETVVLARVVSVRQTYFAELKVERYYRGQGPEMLQVEFRGTDANHSWARSPQAGADMLLELSRDNRGWYAGPCALMVDYDPASPVVQQYLKVLGAGNPPAPGGAPDTKPFPAWLVAVGAIAVAAAGAWWVYRRKRG